MSRTGRDRRLRLRLFELDNNKCPICLTGFTEDGVREGEVVTLEHVPAVSLKAGGFAMCLTCADCNNSASRVENMAMESRRREQKVRLSVSGLPDHTAYVSEGEDDKIDIRMSKLRVPSRVFLESMRSTRSFTLAAATPTSHHASVPWLKAAYLSVFSLLGKYGYRYAQGEAIEQVRGQIMEPSKEIVRQFHFAAPPEWQHEDGVAISLRQRPCWVVKMGNCLVLLPRGWDTSFYEWMESTASGEGKLTLGGGPLWYPRKFGYACPGSITFRADADFLKRNDIFGCTGSRHHDGIKVPFVMVDRSTRHITLLIAPRDSAAV